MTVLAAQDIEWAITHNQLKITPFFDDKQIAHGMSYGLSAAGYDVRINLAENPNLICDHVELASPYEEPHIVLEPGKFMLAVTMEHIDIPNDLIVFVHDKSTWARKGLAVQNTVLEPGWRGYTTLELTNHGEHALKIFHGQPIAQFVFHKLSSPTNKPYTGKYQDQPNRVVEAVMEKPAD